MGVFQEETKMENYSMFVYRCIRGALHCYSYHQQEAVTKPRRMSPVRHQPPTAATLDSQRVRDRERELERIHRRSRELMLTTPPNAAAATNGENDHYGSHHHHHRASRENSVDRISTTSAASSKASSTTHIRRGGPRYVRLF